MRTTRKKKTLNKYLPWDGNPDHWGEYRDQPWCKLILQARERQRNDLRRALDKDPSFPYYFDEKAAQRAIKFFEKHLRHYEGRWAGKPVKLSDFQRWDLIAPAFGWLRHSDGTRRFRYVLWFTSRKEAKSTTAGGAGVYLTFFDGEAAAQGYCAATKSDQAKIVWDSCDALVEGSPMVSAQLKTVGKYIRKVGERSRLSYIGRDSKTQDGFNVHFASIDEYHAHKDSSVKGVLETGTESRNNWQIWIISTAGFNTGSPLVSEVDYAKKVVSGEISNEMSDSYLACMFQPDDPEKWYDDEQIIMANPHVGVTKDLASLKRKAQKALDDPSFRNEFLVKHMNLFASGSEAWIDSILWDKCAGKFEEKELYGLDAFGGLDLGLTQDLSALCLAVRHPETKKVHLIMRYWMPEGQDLHARSRADQIDYVTLAQQGFIRMLPGKRTKADFIRQDIRELAEKFNIREIAVDAWAHPEIFQNLSDDGLVIVKHGQSIRAMTGPVTAFYELALEEQINHNKNPVLKWNVTNAIAVKDSNGNTKLDKQESNFRIDGAVSAVMAVGRLVIQPETEVKARIRSL